MKRFEWSAGKGTFWRVGYSQNLPGKEYTCSVRSAEKNIMKVCLGQGATACSVQQFTNLQQADNKEVALS